MRIITNHTFPNYRPGQATQIIAATGNINYFDIKNSLIPEQNYWNTKYPKKNINTWDGLTFLASMYLTDEDLNTFSQLTQQLIKEKLIITPLEDITEQEIFNIKEHYLQTLQDPVYNEDLEYYPPCDYTITRLYNKNDKQNNTKQISIFTELYDGGVISGTSYLPSMSSEIKMLAHTDTKNTEWEYNYRIHVQRESPTKRYIELPAESKCKNTYQKLHDACLYVLYDLIIKEGE